MSRYQKKHSPTHIFPCSSTILYQLPPSTMIHSILPAQFTCLSLFSPPLTRSSLANLWVWIAPLHTPYISSPNHCPPFTTHAHTIVTCFAVVHSLYILFLVSLSQPHLKLFHLNATHPLDYSHLCLLNCDLIFFPYRPIGTGQMVL